MAQALSADPDTRIAVSERPYHLDGRPGRWMADDAELMDVFVASLGSEDTRRPRMDMGLGIWSDQGSRYYPMETLRASGNFVLDSMDGRRLLVYLDPVTSSPEALLVDTESVRFDGRGFTTRPDAGRWSWGSS